MSANMDICHMIVLNPESHGERLPLVFVDSEPIASLAVVSVISLLCEGVEPLHHPPYHK